MNIKDEDIVSLFFDVTKLNRRYSEMRYRNMSPFKGQIHCLFLLESTGTVTQKELARLLNVRPASASELLVKLEQKGLIRRTPSEQDRRISLVSLTEEGQLQAQKSRRGRALAHREMLADLTDEEKEHFYTALQKIKNHYIHMEEQTDESHKNNAY